MTASRSLPELDRDLALGLAPAPSGRRTLSEPWLSRLAIGLPMLLAAILSLIEINGRSIGFDEAATVTIVSQHGSALGAAIAHDGGNMSGFYLLLHVLIAAFGDGELLVRLPSVIGAVATVGIVGAIARRLFGQRAGVAAGLLCAVSLPLVFWAQNARGYALMVAFVSAAYLVLIRLADPDPEAPQTAGRRRALWAAFVMCMALATYSSFVAVLVFPAQLLILLSPRRRRNIPGFVLGFAAYVLLCVPLIVLAVHRGSGQLFWVPRPDYELEQQVLQSLTSAGLQPSFHATLTTTLLMVLTSAGVLAIGAWYARAGRHGQPSWGAAVALAWLGVPVGLAFVYSLVAQPIFLPRNLLMSVPAVAVVLGAGLGSPRLPRGAALALLGALIVLRAAQVLPAYGVSPEPWQQASELVLRNSSPGDCIGFYPLDGRMAFQYYLARATPAEHAPTEILPIVSWRSNQIFVERYFTLSAAQIASRARGCRRLWFISSHEGQSNGPAESRHHLARYRQLLARLETVFRPAPVRKMGYAAVIHIRLMLRR